MRTKIKVHAFSSRGDTSTEDSADESSFDMEEANRQKLRLMALSAKDLKVTPDHMSVADLGVKQIAYALASSQPWILPSDILELGGEMDRFRVGNFWFPHVHAFST